MAKMLNTIGGNELVILMVYHMAWSGKFHKVYILSFLLSAQQMLSTLVLLYKEARPYWSEHQKHVLVSDNSLANPCIEVMSAIMAAFYMIHKRVHVRDKHARNPCNLFACSFAIIYTLVVMYSQLILRLNTVS